MDHVLRGEVKVLWHEEDRSISELGHGEKDEENSPTGDVGQKENSAMSSCHPKLMLEELYGPFL